MSLLWDISVPDVWSCLCLRLKTITQKIKWRKVGKLRLWFANFTEVEEHFVFLQSWNTIKTFTINHYVVNLRPTEILLFYVIFSSFCVLVCLNAYGVMRGIKYWLVLRKIKLNTSWNTLKLYHLLLTKSSSLTSVIYKSIFSFTLHWIKTKKQQHTIYW